MNKISLTENQVNFLATQPEQGMGYQIVDFKLNSGKALLKGIVFNSTLLQLNENEVITPDNFKKIKLSSKRKWVEV